MLHFCYSFYRCCHLSVVNKTDRGSPTAENKLETIRSAASSAQEFGHSEAVLIQDQLNQANRRKSDRGTPSGQDLID